MGRQALRKLIGLILVSVVLTACSDHQLQPPTTGLRFRLKATYDSVSGSRIVYDYDARNRFVSFTREDGSVGSVLYDDQNRFLQFDYRPGSSTSTPPRNSLAQRTNFFYKSNSPDFTTVTFFYPNGVESFAFYRHYTFNAVNHLTDIQNAALDGVITGFRSLAYTGDNITTERIGPSRAYNIWSYTYDDKPNPYYGLITPYSLIILRINGRSSEDDSWVVRQYSRNNVTSATLLSATYPSQYKYNSQGLPIQETDFSDGPDGGRRITAQTTFTYETY